MAESEVDDEISILEDVKDDGEDSLVDNILYNILKFRKDQGQYPNKIIVHGGKETFIDELNKTISAVDGNSLFDFNTEYNEDSDENKVEFTWEPDDVDDND